MSDAAPGPGRRLVWTTLLAGTGLSALVVWGMAGTSLIVGSVEGRWVYEYIEGVHRRPLAAFALGFALCAAVVAVVPLESVRRRQWPVVLVWLALAFVLQGLFRSSTPFRLADMFASDGSNSFYTPTLHYRAGDLLADFDRIRPTLPTHAQSNMPGKLMLVYALERVTMRPAVLAWLVIALSNAGGLLFYLFVRDLLDDRVAGLLALILYLAVPGKLFFFPVLNTLTPAVFLLFAWLWLRATRGNRGGSAVLAGVALYGLVFFEPLPLIMGVVCSALVARWLWTGEVTWRVVVTQSVLIVAACAATDVAMRIVFGFNLVQTFGQVASAAARFNVEAGRPYGIWVRQNVHDFFFATGICQSVVFVVAVGWIVWMGQASHRVAPLVLGTAVAVVAADLIGINRGEVVRLWIVLACFAQIPAAWFCARVPARTAILLVLATTLLQGALGTSMMNFGAP